MQGVILIRKSVLKPNRNRECMFKQNTLSQRNHTTMRSGCCRHVQLLKYTNNALLVSVLVAVPSREFSAIRYLIWIIYAGFDSL